MFRRLIPRMHLIEFHEQEWCPPVLRHGMRAVLQQISCTLPAYEAVVDELLDAMDRTGTTQVLDLCAGAGGPWVRLAPAVKDDPRIEQVRLTDIFPDMEAMRAMQRQTGDLVQPWADSVDALDVPDDMPGFRTLFNAFHHFEPKRAREILASAVEANQGIGIFELTERRIPASLFVSTAAVPLALGLLPLVRPFRWLYPVFTYLFPLIPAILALDGIVSCLRSYHPDELIKMAREVGPEYEWKAGRVRAPGGPLAVVYLLGVPPAASN